MPQMLQTEREIDTHNTEFDPNGATALVVACVEQRLTKCSYSYYFNRVSWRYERGTLTLEGCVPTFYMKQILQTILRDVENVQRIANDVDVVSSNGLSSEREVDRRWSVTQRTCRHVDRG